MRECLETRDYDFGVNDDHIHAYVVKSGQGYNQVPNQRKSLGSSNWTLLFLWMVGNKV